MAFFGLTALGPQNTFETLSTNFRYIQVFDEDDFKEAWIKAIGKDIHHCNSSRLADITRALFQGPVPLNEQGPIQEAFENGICEVPDTISLDSFMKTMIGLRTEAEEDVKRMEGKPKPTCEFNSSSELSKALKKNAAMKKEVQTKLTAPLTATQEYGWQKQDLVPPVAGRGGSDITKFASELIKNGIYY
ncbi:hypothetical protein B484DRAFT_477360 [Ochromonadaceae sp. CCMP2298]|nr:hypothetical protein B484DRAFT_477360 [Ochromonadaceae sp. CCMP2298]|mmetsp:Transcript_10473/g.23241  ORF Transcript_10473/g.23241 Transcript_10473/m.23241 type:complete len:189 (+) Transcript_10473:76-642(+)